MFYSFGRIIIAVASNAPLVVTPVTLIFMPGVRLETFFVEPSVLSITCRFDRFVNTCIVPTVPSACVTDMEKNP